MPNRPRVGLVNFMQNVLLARTYISDYCKYLYPFIEVTLTP